MKKVLPRSFLKPKRHCVAKLGWIIFRQMKSKGEMGQENR